MSDLIGPSSAYTDILHAAIDEEYKNKKWDLIPLRPSSAGECERALAYKMHQFLGKAEYPEEQKPARIQMLLDLGNSVEWHCIKWFRVASGFFVSRYKQQKVELFELEYKGHKHLIEGSCDDVFWSDKYKAVIDYKSKGDKWSSYRKTQWVEDNDKLERLANHFSTTGYYVDDLETFVEKLDDPYWEANFLQLNSYACTEFFQKRGIDHAVVIQYNKNDSQLREVRFKPCMKIYKRTQKKFQAALEAAVNGEPNEAERTFNMGSIKCAYCPVKALCRPNDDALKAFYRTLKKKWPTDLVKIGGEGPRLQELFNERETLVSGQEELKIIDKEIEATLEKLKEHKIRLDNQDIYELKYLKSPKPHYELRRSKL